MYNVYVPRLNGGNKLCHFRAVCKPLHCRVLFSAAHFRSIRLSVSGRRRHQSISIACFPRADLARPICAGVLNCCLRPVPVIYIKMYFMSWFMRWFISFPKLLFVQNLWFLLYTYIIVHSLYYICTTIFYQNNGPLFCNAKSTVEKMLLLFKHLFILLYYRILFAITPYLSTVHTMYHI